MGTQKKRPDTHITVRLGPYLPMLEEYIRVLGEGRLAPPERSHLIRECIEIGLNALFDKLPAAQKSRVLKAKPAV